MTRPLIGDYRRHESGTPPMPGVAAPWCTFDHAFIMEPGVSELPEPPIK